MKDKIQVVVVIVFFCMGIALGLVYGFNKAVENYYPKVTTVYNISETKDEVIVIDCAGELWSFYGCADWKIGDTCNCIMNSKGTEAIGDDEIICTRKDAWYQSIN